MTDVAAVLWKVAVGQYRGDERMIYLQAREIRVEADPPAVTQVDGDCVGQTPLVARAVPGGVRSAPRRSPAPSDPLLPDSARAPLESRGRLR